MSEQSTSWLVKSRNYLNAAIHIWRDSRLPFLARLLLAVGAIYVLMPCDWFPDSLAIGYLDDLGIVLLVGYFLKRIIPKVIFQDARRAAARTACGILCLNLFIPIHMSSKIEQGLFSRVPGRAVIHVPHGQEASNRANPILRVLSDRSTGAKRPVARGILDNRMWLGAIQNHHLASCASGFVNLSEMSVASDLVPVSGGRQVFHLCRGGKGQVYSSNDAVGAIGSPSFCKALMPSFHTKGGIIVTKSNYSRAGLVTKC